MAKLEAHLAPFEVLGSTRPERLMLSEINRFLAAERRTEMKRVLPLLRNARDRAPSFKFRAYRNTELRQVLQDLSQNKCAYCEAQYDITGFVEVEHYRPKSLYYWLAAEWSNLLPACKRCNNGKPSKFPLVDPRRQARRKGQEKGESPLLLNPSDPAKARRPEKHLTFATTDGAIRADVTKDGPSEGDGCGTAAGLSYLASAARILASALP